MFPQIFRFGVNEKKMLLGRYHVIAIIPAKCLIKDWKKLYKKPTTWRKFRNNKARASNFNKEYLESIKQIVYGLGYYLNELGDSVYYRKNSPLIVEISEGWFIGLAPIIKGVDF